MDRETAERLMETYRRLGALLNEADGLVRRLPVAAEREAHLRAIASMMADVWIELMRPIVREYPDLDPDKEPAP